MNFLFSFLPLPLSLQIYEESKMNLEQERPFVCSAPGCSQVSVQILSAPACSKCTCPPTGKQPSLGNPACPELSFFTNILSKSASRPHPHHRQFTIVLFA